MSPLLEKVAIEANKTPIHGVMVGLFGLFFSDASEFPMDDTSDACKVARAVKKKYGRRAYGFRRCYYLCGERHFIDKGWVFLFGKVRTADEVLHDNLPSESILRDNIKFNKMKAVIICGGQTFNFNPDEDKILKAEGAAQ